MKLLQVQVTAAHGPDMACAGAASFDGPDCPLPLREGTIAWGFVAASSFILTGGTVLFWIRRREPAVAKRDWCNTACFASVAVLAQVSAFLGQSLPCWAFFALNYALAAFIRVS